MKGDKWICNADFIGLSTSVRNGFILIEDDGDYVCHNGELVCGVDSVSAKKYLTKVEAE